MHPFYLCYTTYQIKLNHTPYVMQFCFIFQPSAVLFSISERLKTSFFLETRTLFYAGFKQEDINTNEGVNFLECIYSDLETMHLQCLVFEKNIKKKLDRLNKCKIDVHCRHVRNEKVYKSFMLVS